METLYLGENDVPTALYQIGVSADDQGSQGRITVVLCSTELLVIFSKHMPVSKWNLILCLQNSTLRVAFSFSKNICFRSAPGGGTICLTFLVPNGNS